ncbi:hypothetical protein [Paracoccus sp. (in: a-proteobacteria)]|uniref:hypothetical protein n=1 Tax=Paracoccus sp. TaxID=267 RepID=UPI00321FD4FF
MCLGGRALIPRSLVSSAASSVRSAIRAESSLIGVRHGNRSKLAKRPFIQRAAITDPRVPKRAESRLTAVQHGSRSEIERAASHAARGEVKAC